MKRIFATIILLASLLSSAMAQKEVGGVVRFDSLVHDFGQITTADGPQAHVFTVTNISSEDMVIFAVMTTCGCTKVNWTREAIPAGKNGTISVTYANDEGPYPFDKTIKVYLSSLEKPVILHLKGAVKTKKK